MKTTAKKTNSIQCSIKKVENIEDIESAWLSLELQTTPSFFLTWSWIGPWAKLVLDATDLYLFNCEIDGKNIALCFITLSNQKRFFNLVSSKQVHLNESLLEDYKKTVYDFGHYNFFFAFKRHLVHLGILSQENATFYKKTEDLDVENDIWILGKNILN